MTALMLLALAGGSAAAIVAILLPQLLAFSTAVTYALLLTFLGVLVFLPFGLLQKLRSR